MRIISVLPLLILACAPARSPYKPRDPTLQRQPLYFYPADRSHRPPRAGIFFFGNDIGFWKPHQRLAERLASQGYAVVGFDVKQFLDRLPDSSLLRDTVLLHEMPALIERSLHELGADSVPTIIAGHSFGADIALFMEANSPIPGVVGILALGPTKRDHPIVTINDRVNIGEPTEPGSFSVDEQIRNVPQSVRIALMRGASDKARTSDRDFTAAGGARMSYTVIPFASHSLKSLVIAGPMIERAVDRLLAGGYPYSSRPTPSTPRSRRSAPADGL
ncbi:MAG: hypothetical protein ABI469_10840 [Gemmatimonadales bacterium]